MLKSSCDEQHYQCKSTLEVIVLQLFPYVVHMTESFSSYSHLITYCW